MARRTGSGLGIGSKGRLGVASPASHRRRLATTGTKESQDARQVGRVPKRDGPTPHFNTKAQTGKPKRLNKSASMRVAYSSGGLGGGSTVDASHGNFYSPELSTDFLELPQTQQEQWAYYRFFARAEPYVSQALKLHKELPLSKVRLSMPKATDRKLAEAATRFCEGWDKRVGLLRRLISIVHDYHLIGLANIWVEDNNPEMPEEIRTEIKREVVENEDPETGETAAEMSDEVRTEREDADARAAAWMQKNYTGWTSLKVLPPEQVQRKSYQFTDLATFEILPDSDTKDVIEKARAGDPEAQRIVESMPPDVVASVLAGTNVSLNTDPDAGSFIYLMANKGSDYEDGGHSILEPCIRTLVHRDKLRQSAASIASRHMTPVRIVWAEDMDAGDTEELRDQVDMALQDPDFSIVANFEIRWEEMGSDQRLPDYSSEYDRSDRELYAGLGVTEGLLTGESSYSGDKISLEVINTRYMLLREMLQEFVEENLFKPMCARMGFVEEDEDGHLRVIYPSLSFTRLALRDNQDTFDALFNLYQKGSLDIDVIYELLNIDPVRATEKLKDDTLTVKDSTYNEFLRSIYSEAARKIVEGSDVTAKLAETLGLTYEEPAEEGGGGRF